MTTIHVTYRGEDWTCDASNIGGLVVIAPRDKFDVSNRRRTPPFGRLEFDSHELGSLLDE